MRSRIAIILTLVAGLVITSGSAALGVTALTNHPSASAAQYGASQAAPPAAVATTPSTTTTPPSSAAAGEDTPDAEAETLGTGTGSSDSDPGDGSGTAADGASEEGAQATRGSRPTALAISPSPDTHRSRCC